MGALSASLRFQEKISVELSSTWNWPTALFAGRFMSGSRCDKASVLASISAWVLLAWAAARVWIDCCCWDSSVETSAGNCDCGWATCCRPASQLRAWAEASSREKPAAISSWVMRAACKLKLMS